MHQTVMIHGSTFHASITYWIRWWRFHQRHSHVDSPLSRINDKTSSFRLRYVDAKAIVLFYKTSHNSKAFSHVQVKTCLSIEDALFQKRQLTWIKIIACNFVDRRKVVRVFKKQTSKTTTTWLQKGRPVNIHLRSQKKIYFATSKVKKKN